MNFLRTISALCFLLSAFAQGATVQLWWNRNPEPDVAGYRLHQGAASRTYTAKADAGNNNFGTIEVTPGVTNYLAITAYCDDGRESGYSGEVTFYELPVGYPTGLSYPMWVEGIERVTLIATSAPPASALAVPGFRAWAEIVDINNPANRSKLYAFAPDGGSAYIRFGYDGRTNDVAKSAAFVTAPRKAISIAPPSPVKKAAPKVSTAGSKTGKLSVNQKQ